MTTFGRLSAPTAVIRQAALATAGLAVVCGAVAGPLAHPGAANARPGDVSQRGDRDNRAERELEIRYEAQPNFYFCGPAATRIALTAQGHEVDQHDVAKRLGTTESGTNSALDTTRVLNELAGKDRYRTTEISTPLADDRQTARLARDIVDAVDDRRALVANIAGTMADVDGTRHSYEGGHYVSVVGYRDKGHLAKIADPASPGKPTYWMSTSDLADWIATRGYSH